MPNTVFLRTYLQIYPGNVWDDYAELYGHLILNAARRQQVFWKEIYQILHPELLNAMICWKMCTASFGGSVENYYKNAAPPSFPRKCLIIHYVLINPPAIWRYTAELLKALSNKQFIKCQNLWPYASYLVYDDVEVLHTKEQAPKKYLQNDSVTYSCEAPGCDSGVAKDSRLGLECNVCSWVNMFPTFRRHYLRKRG